MLKAQQPLKRFKPDPLRVDKFDHILSIHPFKLLSTRINLAYEMRLGNNYTFKVTPSLMMAESPLFVDVQNLEVVNNSEVTKFNEQSVLAMVKRYKSSNGSRVYFGPYLGFGMEARRTHLTMLARSNNPGFDDSYFNFSTKRKAVFLALGTTKLFSKNIIFDLYVAIKYQYKITDAGKFSISGLGYKPQFSGMAGFSIGIPLGRIKE